MMWLFTPGTQTRQHKTAAPIVYILYGVALGWGTGTALLYALFVWLSSVPAP